MALSYLEFCIFNSPTFVFFLCVAWPQVKKPNPERPKPQGPKYILILQSLLSLLISFLIIYDALVTRSPSEWTKDTDAAVFLYSRLLAGATFFICSVILWNSPATCTFFWIYSFILQCIFTDIYFHPVNFANLPSHSAFAIIGLVTTGILVLSTSSSCCDCCQVKEKQLLSEDDESFSYDDIVVRSSFISAPPKDSASTSENSEVDSISQGSSSKVDQPSKFQKFTSKLKKFKHRHPMQDTSKASVTDPLLPSNKNPNSNRLSVASMNQTISLHNANVVSTNKMTYSSPVIDAGLQPSQIERFYNWFGSWQDSERFYTNKALNQMIQLGGFSENLESVVEFGCGTGSLAVEILHEMYGEDIDTPPSPCATFVGVEISQTMVNITQDRLASAFPWHLGRFRVKKTDGQVNLDFIPDNSVDRFVATYVFDALSNETLGQLFQTIKRILKPTGRACIVSLTWGQTPMARFITDLWVLMYRLSPRLMGGCRPLQLSQFVEFQSSLETSFDWNILFKEYSTAAYILTSEIVIFEPH